jgi:diamine N-acetyltransferase
VQYYLYLWYDAGEWYQQMRYDPDALAEELSDPRSEFYWIRQEGKKAGYIKINLAAQVKEFDSPSGRPGLEIERIYLYREFAGKGLGKKTMMWVEALARQQEYDFLFLYTMDSSDARLFYEKLGYQKVATKRLPFEKMKPEYRDMYLMIKELR